MSNVSMFLSPELLADQLGRAASDVMLGQELVSQGLSVPAEAVSAFTDAVVAQSESAEIAAIASAWASTDQIAAFEDIKNRGAKFWKDFRTWITQTFRPAADKLTEVARKTLDLAKQAGVTVEHLLANLYRRVITALIELSVPSPFNVSGSTKPVALLPKEVEVSYSLKASLSIPTPDLAGVLKFLSDLANLQLDLKIKLERA